MKKSYTSHKLLSISIIFLIILTTWINHLYYDIDTLEYEKDILKSSLHHNKEIIDTKNKK